MTEPIDVLLGDAVVAARVRANDGVDDGASTQLRIRESLAQRGGGRRRRLTLVAAVIASMFGASAAFAHLAGWRAPWSAPVEHTAPIATTAPVAHAPGRKAPALVTTVEPSVATPVTEEIAAPVQPKPPVIARAPVAAAERTVARPSSPEIAPAPPPTPPPSTSSTSSVRSPIALAPPEPAHAAPEPDADLVTYRRAHELHFHGADDVAALAAWDAYLARFPDGRLAIEARYNRALVLVKLARWVDARTALAPFAAAPAGSYRQVEAAELLAALRDR